MITRLFLVTLAIVMQVGSAAAQGASPAANRVKAGPLGYAWQEIPHTKAMMLVPDGWMVEYEQGTTTLSSGSQSRYYSPTEPFAGALVQVFVSDAPRATGPSFDAARLAEDFMALQSNVVQAPVVREVGGRQIVSAQYAGGDGKGQTVAYLAAFVVEDEVLTVFLAATPEATLESYGPVLERMVLSIFLKTPAGSIA